MKVNVNYFKNYTFWEDVTSEMKRFFIDAREKGEILEIYKEYDLGDPAFKKDHIYSIPYSYSIPKFADRVVFKCGTEERVMKDRNAK
jgi:hypothetical protein